MNVNTYSGSVTLQANGGKGGDEDDAGTVQRCYGAGGGGSGGIMYFKGSVPAVPISTTGGAGGVEVAGDPGCNAHVLPAGGLNGSTVPSYTLRQSTDSASYCLSISALPVRLVYFKIAAQGSAIQLNWRVGDPELMQEFIIEKIKDDNWQSLGQLMADNLEENYAYTDQHPKAGINLYRLKLIERTGSFFYSPVRQLNFGQRGNAFVLYPNPASHQVTVAGDFSSMVEIRIFDIAGRLKWHKEVLSNVESISIDVSPLQAGVYLLQIGKEIKKLVIAK